MEESSESSADIRRRVIKARQIQKERYKNENILTNSELTSEMVKKYCQIEENAQEIFKLKHSIFNKPCVNIQYLFFKQIKHFPIMSMFNFYNRA